MALAIIGLISSLVTLFFYLLKRKNERADLPEVRLQKQFDENNKAIARGDVNDLLDDRLLHTHPNNLSGQGSHPDANK